MGLLTLGVYRSVVHYDFINLDDYDYVKENPNVTGGLTSSSVAWAFRAGHSGNWHPLTWLSHMLDVEAHGLKPGGHHFTNVLFHVANTLLLLLVLNKMTGSFWPGTAVAALFGLHPTHVESVAWIAERKDVLSTFFFMLTLWAYAQYAQFERSLLPQPSAPVKTEPLREGLNVRKAFWYLLALLLFAFGLMSKPMLVTLPCLLLLLDHWPLRRFEFSKAGLLSSRFRWLVLEKVPFFILSALSSIVTVWAQRRGRAVVSFEELPFPDRLANATNSYFGYLEKLFWPSDLAVFYPYLGTPSTGRLLIAALVILGVSIVALQRAKETPFLMTGWFWFIGTLVPVIGLVQVGGQAMADRYLYIPSIGIFLAMIWGLHEAIRSNLGKRILALATAAVIAVCAVLTYEQLKHWKDGKSLFTHTHKVTQKNYMAAIVLGNLVAQEGKFEEALQFFAEATQQKIDHPDAYLYSGRALERLNRIEEAASAYAKAIELKPGYAEAHVGLGSALARQRRFDEAIEQYRHAAELKPNSWESQAGLGLALESSGRFEEALPHLRNLVSLRPTNAEAHFSLAIALRETGRTNEAQQHIAQVLSLDPKLPGKFFDIGKSMLTQGDVFGATSRFKAVLEMQPNHVEAHQQLGLLLAQSAQYAEALVHFREVARLRPDAQAYYQLALASNLHGQPAEASKYYHQAIDLRPDWPEALNDLAWLLATHPQTEIRNGAEAVRLAERACVLTDQKQARFLGTLDAAYAEAGRFEEALATARRAQDLASSAGQPELAAAARERISVYEAKKPFRQP